MQYDLFQEFDPPPTGQPVRRCPERSIMVPAGRIWAVDFGTDKNLAICGPEGSVDLKGLRACWKHAGRNNALPKDQFINTLRSLLYGEPTYGTAGLEAGHVVFESPTVGSSGVEPEEVAKLAADAPNNLYVISARATKIYKGDHPEIPWDKPGGKATAESHAVDAGILLTIATQQPYKLARWKLNTDPLRRNNRSPRPHDKRGYEGEKVEVYLRRLPPFHTLPMHLQVFAGDPKKGEYNRSLVLPLAMAMDEKGAWTRSGFERIIGLSEHGYPSFYRRNNAKMMKKMARKKAELAGSEDLEQDWKLPEYRGPAWNPTRKNIRHLYALMTQHMQSS